MRQDRDDSESDIIVVPEYRDDIEYASRIDPAPLIIPDIRPEQGARINTPRIDPVPLIISDIRPIKHVKINTPRPARSNPVEPVRRPRPQLDQMAADAKSAITMDIVYQLILAMQYILLSIRYRVVRIPAAICVLLTLCSTCVLCNFNSAEDDASRRRITKDFSGIRNFCMALYYSFMLALSYFISLIVLLFTSNVIPGLWMAALGVDVKSGEYAENSKLINIGTILFMLLPVQLVVYQMFAKADVAKMNYG